MPNSLGNRDNRRISTRQRVLHPSMLSFIDISDSSSSDPGRSGSLTPYNKLDSFYFDNSLYENEMHYKIHQLLNEYPLDDEYEELIIKCDNEKEYNNTLDALFKYSENKIKISGTTLDPFEIIIEKDPRDSYRKFDESNLMDEQTEDIK